MELLKVAAEQKVEKARLAAENKAKWANERHVESMWMLL
jgi:hypothetical protein